MNRGRGKYELTLESSDLKLGFNLARDGGRAPVITTEMNPARLDEAARNADVPRVIDNLDAGMGYSRRLAAVPNGYAYTLPGYTRSPGAIFCPAGKLTEITLPPTGTGPGQWTPYAIKDSMFFGDSVFLAGLGNDMLRIEPFNPYTAQVDHQFAPPFTADSVVVFNNRLYFGGGQGLAYRDLPPGGGWSAVSTGVARGYLKAVTWRPLGVPTQVMIGSSLDFNGGAVRWVPITADPMVDNNWAAPVPVGADRRYGINRIETAPQHAFMFRPDGVYDLDELGTRAFNIAPWVAQAVDGQNGAWGMHMGNGLYYSTTQGLAFVPTTGEAQYRPEWAQPGWGLPYEGPIFGTPFAGTLHQGWSMVGISVSGTTYVMAGRRDQAAYGQSTHIWHGAEAILPGTVTHMKVHMIELTAGSPRLLIAITDFLTGAPRLYWQSLTKWGSPIQEMLFGGPFEPAPLSSLFLPADPWDRPSAVKTLLELDIVAERLTTANILKLYGGADQDALTAQGTATEGTYNAFAPLETTEGRYLNVRVDAVGSPILRSLELRAAVGIDLREARVYRVVLGYDNGLATPRGRETRDPEQKLNDLRTMLGRVVTLEDEYPMRVRVLQVLAPERHQSSAPNRAGSWMMVVPIMVSILDHPFYYDRADRYDTDRTWS
jgi:hypothetical protein